MKRASISQAKNALSALLDRVRHGQAVVIEDRGIPVARLEPIVAGADPHGRAARLERQGLVRPGSRRLPEKWLRTRPPRLVRGKAASSIVISERGESR